MMPLQRALLWILLSVLVVSGTATALWTIYRYRLRGRSGDDRYRLEVVVQRPLGPRLATAYLVEQMDFSIDRPFNLFALSLRERAGRLVESPVIRSARLSRLLPSALLVEYEARVPIAHLFDYSNTAMDEEGRLFPVAPLYSPKRLPEVVLGLDPLEEGEWPWEVEIDQRRVELALDLLSRLKCVGLLVQRLDVSSAFAKSCGRREIVVTLEGGGVLRLGLSGVDQALYNYLLLRKQGLDASVVDLRLPSLAFLDG